MTTAAGFTSGLIAGKLWIDKERALYRMSRRLSQVRAEKERLSFDYVRLQREATVTCYTFAPKSRTV